MAKKGKSKTDIALETLYKKAIGYQTEEVVEEYASEEKGGELLKRKVTTKYIPPDVSALKSYMELTRVDNEFDNLTDEELEREKQRLIKLLVEKENKNENRKNNNKM